MFPKTVAQGAKTTFFSWCVNREINSASNMTWETQCILRGSWSAFHLYLLCCTGTSGWRPAVTTVIIKFPGHLCIKKQTEGTYRTFKTHFSCHTPCRAKTGLFVRGKPAAVYINEQGIVNTCLWKEGSLNIITNLSLGRFPKIFKA